MEKSGSGYPSIDKPWLKYYSDKLLNTPLTICGMYDFIYQRNQNHLQSTALNYFGKKVSYGDFFQRVDRAARAFSALGVKAGDIIGLVTLSCIPSVVSMYALNRIGAVPNYLNVLSTEEELGHFFQEGKSKLVITLDLFGEKVLRAAKNSSVEKVIVYSLREDMPPLTALGFAYKTRKLDRQFLNDPAIALWKDFLKGAEGQGNISYRKNGSLLAYLGHTGGTTGVPKGVMLCDHSFNLVAHSYGLCMPHNVGDVFLSVMIPYVVYSTVINIHMPLSLGFETVLVPKFEPDKWDFYIKKYHPQHCGIIPAYAQALLGNKRLDKMDLSCLKTIGMGGEGLNIPLEKQINLFLSEHKSSARLLKGYGMTEVCATAATEYAFARKLGSVGIPLPENNFMIYDSESGQECPYGVSGEVCMQCGSQMIGYLDSEEEMRKFLRRHPDGTLWCHTGDIGYIDEDGFLFLEGRIKRMIMTVLDGKVYKISPAKVEQLLCSHDAVYDACVVCASEKNDKVLKAYLILRDSADEDSALAELRDICKKQLPDNMQPRFYEILREFPRTAADKVDYQALES